VTWICGLIAKTKSGRVSRTGLAVNEDTEGSSYFFGEEEERKPIFSGRRRISTFDLCC
jgi:hypothetical protein